MGVVAEFSIVPGAFAFGSVVDVDPAVEIELDRISPSTGAGVPYLWATGSDLEAFERGVRESPLVEDLVVVERVDDSVLYRLEWNPGAGSLLREVARSNVTVLEAYRDGDWFFRLRFDDHDDLSAFHDFCSTHDVNYRLERVYTDRRGQSDDFEFGLTAQQRDTLVLAVERGYFEVPRGVTLQELGEELGVTQQAASERVRRAADKVLRTTLHVGSGTEE